MNIEKLEKAIRKARDEAESVGLDRITAPFKETDMILYYLELVKKQEPKKPTVDEYGNKRCSACGNKLQSIFDEDLYCRKCGQAVKWE